ncbi:MAG TPA: GerMN domain-containing protein, partial [Ktedonobacterales bacterium]|nr:GerMN domain-containing protein [Ktedonobacterales bacterium]
FSKHPDSDNTPRLVFPVDRRSPDLQVATFAIQQLILGPTQAEKQQGYFTPLEGAFSGTSIFGNSDFKITLNMNGTKPEMGTATLQFGRDMKGLGDTGAAMATNEIVTTLTQFPTIQRVVILNKDGSHFDNMFG